MEGITRIFDKLQSVKESSKHSVSAAMHKFRDTTYLLIHIHRTEFDGIFVEDTCDTYYTPFDDVMAWLDKWAEIIAKEREEDEREESID